MDEVLLYMQEPTADINASPLEWWKHNGNRYHPLSLLALKYLGIPATSVPSERVFSKAGKIVSRRRASLKPSNVHGLSSFSLEKPFSRSAVVYTVFFSALTLVVYWSSCIDVVSFVTL